MWCKKLSTARESVKALFILLCFAQNTAANAGNAAAQVDSAKPSSATSADTPQLDSKLRRAMSLYYDGQYRLALPILQEISVNDNRTEILFWLGRSAYEAGADKLAIEKYQQILTKQPALSRVRLELAAAYAKSGNPDAAQSELQKILDANKDPGLQQQIEQAMDGLTQSNEPDKRFFTSLRASIGTEYDSNVNAGPRDKRILLANKDALISKSLDGWLLKFNVNGDAIYDFGEANGFVWHSRLQFLHNEYTGKTNSDFNYTQTDAATGIDYYSPVFKARVPVGFIDRRFSNKDLSHAYYVMPNFEVSLNENIDLAFSYRYENEHFLDSSYAALSNATHIGTFGPRLKFTAFDARHSLSLLGSYSRRNADTSRFSYNEWSVGPSYFVHFNSGTDAYFDFRYLNRNYDAPALAFPEKGDRSDDRYTVSFSLSQTFYRNFFVSLSYTYTDNLSNVPLFAYDKQLIGLNIGTNLNF